MPYTEYICPDGQTCKIEDCLKACRLRGKINPETGLPYCPGGRCLSRQTLLAIADQREWTGKPSTTQLLGGTREAYLKLTENYAINPKDSLFMLHGTKVHGVLENYTDEQALSEIRLDDGVSTGAFDYYDEAECEGENRGYLYDHKTYGSYKAAKVLGIRVEKELVGKYKNGKPKYRNVVKHDGPKHRLDLAIQLNDYRMKLKKCLGKDVDKMLCEIIVRDGSTYMANGRGITENGYLVPVNKISDHWVELYMKEKARRLSKALEEKKCPPPCRPSEVWGGTKCKGFCPVRQFCKNCPYDKE